MSVKIREKRGKLYLDIYTAGKRTWEALHLSLTENKNQNKEIMRLADICRSKKETQLLAGSWDIQDPIAGRKKLVTYLEELAKIRANNDYITGCIRYLKNYNSTIQLSQITPQWVDGFQRFLLNGTKLIPWQSCSVTRILNRWQNTRKRPTNCAAARLPRSRKYGYDSLDGKR